jgi:uncharacterized protein YcfJ
MKRILVLTAATLACGLGWAQEHGRVLSVTPLVQQVAVPRQVCTTEQVAVQQPKSGAGAVMGALAGGAIGNAVGNGPGQAAATMAGIVGGAIVGDRIEGTPAPQLQNVQRCSVQTVYENRGTLYTVVYEYAGKQYTVQLPYDPGKAIALQLTPAGLGAPATSTIPAAPATVVQPVSVQTTPVVVAPYPAYYYGPPIDIRLGWGGWGYWGGPPHGHGPRHWR